MMTDQVNAEGVPCTVVGTEVVTVLEALRGTASKRITPTETKSYRVGKFFNIHEHVVNNLHDLHRLLKDLQSETKRFIIRGKPIGPARNYVTRRSVGEDATFADRPIHWICIDVDGVGDVNGPPRAEIFDLVDRCPHLQGIRCVAQVSSSWAVKPGIRAHLWFWLEEPRTSRQVSEWAASLPFKVDNALFGPVQPHYTADPEFDSCPDPLEGQDRVFMTDGQSDALYIPSGQAETEVQYWIDKIITVSDDDPRHPLINKAGYSLGGWVGAGVFGADELVDILLRACEDSGAFESDRIGDAKSEVTRAIADGAKNPRNHEDWRNGMIRNKEGVIKLLPENVTQILKTHSAMIKVFGFDLRTQEPRLLKRPPWGGVGGYPRSVSDADDMEATSWINRVGLHTASVNLVSQGITAAAADNPFDLVVDWLDGLPPWDRSERLYRWLPRVTGCPDSLYHRAVGAKFIMSLVARATRPGCKVDDMMVLVGQQGSLKSTLLSRIVSGPGEWAFSDCLGDIRSPKEYVPSLMGPWLIEVAELASFNKKEVEAVKKFLSTKTDRYRMPYGRRAVEIPRRGVVAGTSNNTSFLSDITGNRRFWPVDVERLDLAKFERDQIFAEALHLVRGGAVWYLEGEEIKMAIEEQESHRVVDPYEDSVREYIDGPPDSADLQEVIDNRRDQVTVKEILTDVLMIPPGQAHSGHQRRVGQILKSFGWEKTRPCVRGKREWGYRRPVVTLVDEEIG